MSAGWDRDITPATSHRGKRKLRLRRPASAFRAGAHRLGVPVTPWPEGWYGDLVPVARGACAQPDCPDRIAGASHLHLDTV
jgi:hypothetical protein